MERFLGKYIKRNGGDPIYVLASFTYMDILNLGKRLNCLLVLKKINNRLVEDYLAVSEIRSDNNRLYIIGRYKMGLNYSSFVEVSPVDPGFQNFLLEPVSMFLNKIKQYLVRTIKSDRRNYLRELYSRKTSGEFSKYPRYRKEMIKALREFLNPTKNLTMVSSM